MKYLKFIKAIKIDDVAHIVEIFINSPLQIEFSKRALSFVKKGTSKQHISTLLSVFGPPFGMCWDMLGVVCSGLKMVKFKPTTPNMHVATGWPNVGNTMLR